MEELDELKPLSKGNEGLRKHGRVGAVVGMDGRGRGGDGDCSLRVWELSDSAFLAARHWKEYGRKGRA